MTKMNELANTTVTIAGKEYTISIDKRDEEIIQHAAQMIEDKMKEFDKPQYKNADVRDLLSMVVLNFATALLAKDKNVNNLRQDFIDKILRLDEQLQNSI